MVRIFLLVWALMLCWPAFAGAGSRIIVPVRDIDRGETISSSDLVVRTVDGDAFPGVITSAKDLVGMEPRRMLRAGEGIRMQDVRRPTLVTKGSTVSMLYEAPGITVTAIGRAMSAGGLGETVTVQNPVSFRQIGAMVIGPGQVRALDSGATISPSIASNKP